MGLLTKDQDERLSDTFDYIDATGAPKPKRDLLWNWVYSNGLFSSASVSGAMSLDAGLKTKLATSKSLRNAVRATIMARLAVERPPSLSAATPWKSVYLAKSETDLKGLMNGFLSRLTPPAPLVVTPAPVTPSAYSLGNIQAARNALKPTGGVVKPAATVTPPVVTPSVTANREFYEKVSRIHVILSGHGSWDFDPAINSWHFVNLKRNQILRTYIEHYYPLGNTKGQLVDSRQFPDPTDEYPGGSEVFDYTLHERQTLTLLNHSGGRRALQDGQNAHAAEHFSGRSAV